MGGFGSGTLSKSTGADKRRKSSVQQVQFNATGSDYFRLWLPDLVLTVLTLGIYSAWAKARRLRYFAQSTFVANDSFDFHGSGEAILKGRIALVAVAGLFYLFDAIGPRYVETSSVLFALLFPIFTCQAWKYRTLNTSYRGVRFGFHGTQGEAFLSLAGPALAAGLGTGLLVSLVKSYLGAFFQVMLVFVSSAMLFGYLQFATRSFFWKHLGYGNGRFDIQLRAPDLLLSWLVGALGLFVAAMVAISGMGHVFAFPAWSYYLVLFSLGLLGLSYVESESRHRIADGLSLREVRFETNISPLPLFFLRLKCAVLSVVTLGLYIPWARVELWKYRVESYTVHFDGPINFAAQESQSEEESAVGDSIVEGLTWDFGF